MKLLILGAGVEKNLGMPLANDLFSEIRNFIKGVELGKKVDEILLKVIIKDLDFSYDKVIHKIVSKLAIEYKKELEIIKNDMEGILNDNSNIEDKKLAELIKMLSETVLKKESKQQEEENLEEILQKIKDIQEYINFPSEVIGHKSNITFESIFQEVMKVILMHSIEKRDHKVLKYIYDNIMDYEYLLLRHFIGFYNDDETDIKIYLYLSWSLWAYLVWKEIEASRKICLEGFSSEKKIPIYSDLKNNRDKINIITFNYTSFAGRFNDNTIYFHGRLNKFIRVDNKNESDIDNYENINIVNFFEDIVRTNISFDNKKYIIPAIIPPLKIKPVISSSYLETWSEAKRLIEEAEKIVIIGYSFNYADEHINDLIRKNMNKDIIIINPDIEGIKTNVEKIFSIKNEDFVINKYKGKLTYEIRKLKLIDAKAEEIDVNSLF